MTCSGRRLLTTCSRDGKHDEARCGCKAAERGTCCLSRSHAMPIGTKLVGRIKSSVQVATILKAHWSCRAEVRQTVELAVCERDACSPEDSTGEEIRSSQIVFLPIPKVEFGLKRLKHGLSKVAIA